MPQDDTAAAPTTRRIADLVSSRLQVPADEAVSRVAALWEDHPDEDGMAVVGGERIRYLSRARFFLQLGKKFGYSLFEHRPVSLLAEDGSTVDADVDPVEVISLASQRDPERVFDDVIVLEGGAFLGLVSMRSLLVHHRALLVEGMAERARLEEGNRRLREMTRLHAGLSARLAAELRDPVNALAALASALSVDPDVQDRHGRTLSALASRAREIGTLVNDLQDLSRLEAGTLEISPEQVVPAPCVRAAVELVRRRGALPSVDAELGRLAAPVRTDPLVLERAVGALLGLATVLEPPPAVRLEGWSDAGGLVLRVAFLGAGAPEPATLLAAASTRPGLARGLALARGFAGLLRGAVEPVDGALELRLPSTLG
jgi:signal transduction histidine kinase